MSLFRRVDKKYNDAYINFRHLSLVSLRIFSPKNFLFSYWQFSFMSFYLRDIKYVLAAGSLYIVLIKVKKGIFFILFLLFSLRYQGKRRDSRCFFFAYFCYHFNALKCCRYSFWTEDFLLWKKYSTSPVSLYPVPIHTIHLWIILFVFWSISSSSSWIKTKKKNKKKYNNSYTTQFKQ